APAKKSTPNSDFGIKPASEQTRPTAARDGLSDAFEKLGAPRFTNGCRPCTGQWDRSDSTGDEKNTTVPSFNRNVSNRADRNPHTHAFVGSPEMVAAIAVSGR